MATAHALADAGSSSTDQLVAILSGPLPELPAGEVHQVAGELRRMASERARVVWRHPGWASVVAWILVRVPDCDPTIAAIHAVRNARRASSDPGYARSLAGYVRQVAKGSSVDRRSRPRHIEELTWDPPEPPYIPARPADSLADDAARLLSVCAVRVSGAAWQVIAPGIDVAVDWWDGLAARTGLLGDELVVAARRSPKLTGNHRLRAHFDGVTARPLVALLVGGDQRGRWARQAAGTEAGLLYWSLQSRRVTCRGEPPPVPPAPVCRAWATHIGGIERALAATGIAVEPGAGPTIAA